MTTTTTIREVRCLEVSGPAEIMPVEERQLQMLDVYPEFARRPAGGGCDPGHRHLRRSPATRWHTQDQAIELYQAARLADIHVVRGFTDEPAASSDTIFSVFGNRP